MPDWTRQALRANRLILSAIYKAWRYIITRTLRTFGFAFDKAVEMGFIQLLWRIGISLSPSQSRWGFISFLLSFGLFFIAVAMQPSNPDGSKGWWVMASWGLGIAALLLALTTSLWFLRNRGYEEENPRILQIQENTNQIQAIVDATQRNIDRLQILTETLVNQHADVLRLIGEIQEQTRQIQEQNRQQSRRVIYVGRYRHFYRM